MESPKCPYIEGCPMFQYFRSYAKKVYMESYCEGNFEKCKRYILRTSGQPVPKNLLPHGGKLWDDKH
jgi:hypothetical protein